MSDLSPVASALIIAFGLIAFLALAVIPWFLSKKKSTDDTDDYLSSRNTQSWWSIALSLYAAGVGTWALTAPAETAATAGWWASLGYTFGCGCCWSVLLWSGPRLRKLLGKRGFTSLRFVDERYGRTVGTITSLNSFVYMGTSVVTELTAVATCVQAISSKSNKLGIVISVALITTLYVLAGGMPSTFLGDRICAVLIAVLVAVVYAAIFGKVLPKIDHESWKAVNTWQAEGIPYGLVLIVACFIVEQANQSSWQKAFAAKSTRDMQKGLIVACLMYTPSLFLFGFAGFVGSAAAKAHYVSDTVEYATLFNLLTTLPKALSGITVFLLVVLVTSTIVTAQSGICGLLVDTVMGTPKLRPWAPFTMAGLMVPLTVIAALNPPSIVQIYMVGNIVSVCVVPTTLLGFTWRVTPEGAVFGIVCSFLSVLTYGWAHLKTFKGGFQWILFPDGYDWHCFATFVMAVAVCTLFTLGFSWVQFKLYPEHIELNKLRLRNIVEARQELFEVDDESNTLRAVPEVI